jgi:transposase
MNYEARQVRNNILINLTKLGISQAQMGEILHVEQQTISKILKKHREQKPLTAKPSGAPRKLTKEQRSELPFHLKKGAPFYELEGDYWTQARVKVVIQRVFGVEYEVKQVGRILKEINWTLQKPQKKDAKQSLEKVEEWKKHQLNALKKKR